MMVEYDVLNFDPPAPVARVALRGVEGNSPISDITLLIDSGADITLIPRWSVQQLGALTIKNDQFELIGFDGSRSFAKVVLLDMILLRTVFRGPYVLIEAEQGILGRDVLNHIKLSLNGPELNCEIKI